MKSLIFKTFLYEKVYSNTYTFVALAMLCVAGCEKILEEHPKSDVTPEIYSSQIGLQGGIAGVYSNLRNLWGTEGFCVLCVAGTDEHLAGGSASNITYYTYNGVNVNATGGLWGVAYTNINTINGILETGPTVDMPEETLTMFMAQAKFMRAFLYYFLVQAFGDVPLHLTFISEPSTSDTRAPVADVYEAIIQDLNDAAADLPNTPTAPFTGKAATRATALAFLSKVYLTRGWSSAAEPNDFVEAYTIAEDLIANKDTYGLDLWQDFRDANRDGNDYGKETLFVIDHNSDSKYGEWAAQAAGGKVNIMASLYRPNYPTMKADYPANTGSSVMVRDVANGRPFIRTRPNSNYILNQAFAERVNDSRYEKSFQTVWINNVAGVVTPRGTLTVGVDTAMDAPFEVSSARAASFKGIILTPKGDLDDDGDIDGNTYTPVFFPALSKFNDPTRAHMNDPSDRPLILFRFAEVYLNAAEAYFKAGNNDQAAEMINVVRRRAAYRSTNDAAANDAAALAMEIDAGDVTLDLILDERTREFYGEMLRWWDLVRTGQLLNRVTLWNTEAAPYIQAYIVLRPIPVQTDRPYDPKWDNNPGY
jgi:hypothetical protein